MELQNGYLVGIPPSTWLPKLCCKIVGAKTFHWLMLVGRDPKGWMCSESINKGTALTRFNYDKAYIYKIKNIPEPSMYKLISIHSWHGWCEYDNLVNFRTAIWFILKHYLKIIIPVIHNHKFNCQEHVVYMASELGVKLIAENEYPFCVNLEKSPMLEYLGSMRT